MEAVRDELHAPRAFSSLMFRLFNPGKAAELRQRGATRVTEIMSAEERHKREAREQKTAALVSRTLSLQGAPGVAIDPEAFYWRGHDLHKALLRGFPAHKRAVVELRLYLRGKDRLRLEEAWANYHGGSEENPDFFVMYCLPANGPELLKQRLEALRDAGKHT